MEDHSKEDYSETHQEIQKKYQDNSRIIREFREGELVFAKNFYTWPRWKKGVVTRRTDPVWYESKLESRTVVRRHVNHIKKRTMLDSDRASEIERTSPQKRKQNSDTDWFHWPQMPVVQVVLIWPRKWQLVWGIHSMRLQ